MRRRRKWVRNVVALGVVGAFLLCLSFVLFRPATVLGVDRETLAQSVATEAGLSRGTCEKGDDGGWRCWATDSYGDRGAYYRVHVHHLGCWDADPISPPGARRQLRREARPVRSGASGCIGLADVLFSGGGGSGD